MTGTSMALKRLGVAGLSAVVATIGIGTFSVGTAFAAAGATPTTAVALDKTSDTASAGPVGGGGTCNAFTATVDAGKTVTVQIQQALPNDTGGGATHSIGFCQPSNPTGGQTPDGPGTVTATPGSPGAAAGTTVNAGKCYNSNAPVAPATTRTDTVSCYATFTDNGTTGGTASDGKVVFGVWSTDAGTMNIDAFGDTSAAGTVGVHDSGEPGVQATKTWVATSKLDAGDKINCTPASDTDPVSDPGGHVITCTVTNSSGVAIPAANNLFYIVDAGGPDANAAPTACTTTGNNDKGNPSGPVATTNTAGMATCTLNNGGQPGTDTVRIYLEQNGQTGLQANSPEPQTTVQKSWVQAAPNGSTISVTCSPNQTQAPSSTNGQSSVCQLNTSQKTATVTAKVTNGSNPVAPVVGVIVNFTEANNGGTADSPDTDTESVSPASCTTDSSGSCSTTFTDTKPTNGEKLLVTATVTRQGAAPTGGPTSATASINYHNANSNEARNIVVAPHSAAQPAGGAQTLVAKVTDEVGGPVQGACVGWTEAGPGRITQTGSNNPGPFFLNCFPEDTNGAATGSQYDAACITDATGACSVEVTSQTAESGAETVVADLQNDYNASNPLTGNAFECNEAAGQSFNNTNTSGAFPAATTKGNCTDTATVTWNANQQGGTLAITSFTNNNPAACSSFTISGTAPSSATVTLTGFNFRQNTFTIGTATAGPTGQWTFTGSGICFNTTVTASTGSGSGATNSNTVTLGFHQVFTNVHFTRVGPYRRGLIEYNVSGSSTSIVGGEPIRVQNSACRSGLCGITHMRSNGFDRLHIYLLPGTYTFTLYGTGGSDAQFGGDGHQYLNAGRTTFTVTIH
jgi:hypothetical protein